MTGAAPLKYEDPTNLVGENVRASGTPGEATPRRHRLRHPPTTSVTAAARPSEPRRAGLNTVHHQRLAANRELRKGTSMTGRQYLGISTTNWCISSDTLRPADDMRSTLAWK